MTNEPKDAPRKGGEHDTPRRAAYIPPSLIAYGSLAKLTRSGVGTAMERTGPTNRFA